MSRITDLSPRHLQRPQCDVTVDEMDMPYHIRNNQYRLDTCARSGLDPSRCKKTSKYIIDGRYLCAFHAGIKAIDILMKEPGS
jgi:hypothetical protein